MKYALLIYDNEAAWEGRTKEEGDKLMADYFAFSEEIAKSGHEGGGEALHSVSTASPSGVSTQAWPWRPVRG